MAAWFVWHKDNAGREHPAIYYDYIPDSHVGKQGNITYKTEVISNSSNLNLAALAVMYADCRKFPENPAPEVQHWLGL